MTIDVVVGGMYGSEAKGSATAALVRRRITEQTEITNIRVGGPNAGHTAYDEGGRRWALRQLPVGVTVRVPEHVDLCLEIAAGSEVDPTVLIEEITQAKQAGLLDDKRLVVHGEATVIAYRHRQTEQRLIGEIGSTGKGIGAARADRLLRTAERVMDDQLLVDQLTELGIPVVTGDEAAWRDGYDIIIEGTQGYALGLHAGHYPKCTAGDCRAIDFLAQAGVNPWNDPDFTVWVVGRVYPIRVAGNSGPMENEVTWADLQLPEERTTVTQKVRRVGLPDWRLMHRAVQANGPSNVVAAVFMLDQMFPNVKDQPYNPDSDRWFEAEQYIKQIETEVGAPVRLVGSGPQTLEWRNQ